MTAPADTPGQLAGRTSKRHTSAAVPREGPSGPCRFPSNQGQVASDTKASVLGPPVETWVSCASPDAASGGAAPTVTGGAGKAPAASGAASTSSGVRPPQAPS